LNAASTQPRPPAQGRSRISPRSAQHRALSAEQIRNDPYAGRSRTAGPRGCWPGLAAPGCWPHAQRPASPRRLWFATEGWGLRAEKEQGALGGQARGFSAPTGSPRSGRCRATPVRRSNEAGICFLEETGPRAREMSSGLSLAPRGPSIRSGGPGDRHRRAPSSQMQVLNLFWSLTERAKFFVEQRFLELDGRRWSVDSFAGGSSVATAQPLRAAGKDGSPNMSLDTRLFPPGCACSPGGGGGSARSGRRTRPISPQLMRKQKPRSLPGAKASRSGLALPNDLPGGRSVRSRSSLS